MTRNKWGLRIPEGMHDLLPAELALQENLESELLSLFDIWSYRKVLTPTMEFGACVQPDLDKGQQLYKFFDRQGLALVLRPELTTPIARLVSTRFKEAELPLRLCYSADVYRNTAVRQREFRQSGVELIGSNDPLADAEVIALAAEGLRRLGIKDFQINLGHMGIFRGLVAESGIDLDMQIRLEELLARKDMVGIETLVEQSELPEQVKEMLYRLPHLRGGKEILDEVLSWSSSPVIIEAAESLQTVYRYLEDFSVQEFVALDLGILRGFDYYTGIIFEGYAPGVGFPVVEGGRYDSLYAEFGEGLPATGFAVNLGSLLSLLPLPEVKGAEILVFGQDRQQVVRLCQKLRRQGRRVEMLLGAQSLAEAQDQARKKNIAEVLEAATAED